MKEPGEQRISPFVLYPTLTYLLAVVVFGVVWYFLMVTIAEFSPSDPEVQIRFLAGKATLVIAGMAVVNGLIHLLNVGFKGKLLEQIVSTSNGAALYGVGQLICATALWFAY